MGIDFNGVNGNSPLFGTNKTNSTDDVKKQEKFDFGFNTKDIDSTVGMDEVKFSATKPAFNSYDLDQMYALAGIPKPESVKPLEKTIALAAEGAEYGTKYSEEDMNLARFMFENLKA